MNFIKKIKIIFGSYEKAYEIIFTELTEYSDVEGLDNLINLISCLHEKNYFVEFLNVVDGIINSYEYTHTKNPISNSKNDFIKMAATQLEFRKFPRKHLITLTSLEAVLSIVELNFYFYSNGIIKSVKDVSDLIFHGNIISPLTFFVEDYEDDLPLPTYSKEFFQDLSNINFDGQKSKQLYNDILWEYFSLILNENGTTQITRRFNNTIWVCAKYLMACNALKYGRDSVTCEDVVVGYTTALRLLTEDVREYVIKYSGANERNSKISNFERTNNDIEIVQNEGIGFKGVVSIIFSILAFFEVLILIIYIKEIIFPAIPTYNPIFRIPALLISLFFAKKFYNYLSEGNDKDLFEDGKSKGMLVFIIVFIITIIVGVTMF